MLYFSLLVFLMFFSILVGFIISYLGVKHFKIKYKIVIPIFLIYIIIIFVVTIVIPGYYTISSFFQDNFCYLTGGVYFDEFTDRCN